MLNECRKALRIQTDAYDEDLCGLMSAGAKDLEIAGVRLPGTVSFHPVTTTTGTGTDATTVTTWHDDSRLHDPLVMRAIFTYVKMLFLQSSADNDRVKESYNIQKTQLMHASGYTQYEDGGELS